MAGRLPAARGFMEDMTALPIPLGYERLVAEEDERILGLAQFTRRGRYVKYLFVDPDAQGQGIGGALLDAAEQQLGLPVRLTTLALNQEATIFYLRRGYHIVGGTIEDDWQGEQVVWIELEKRWR